MRDRPFIGLPCHLELPAPLAAGATYQIGAARDGLEEYLHDPPELTPSIRVNELGYRGEANDRGASVTGWDAPPWRTDDLLFSWSIPTMGGPLWRGGWPSSAG